MARNAGKVEGSRSLTKHTWFSPLPASLPTKASHALRVNLSDCPLFSSSWVGLTPLWPGLLFQYGELVHHLPHVLKSPAHHSDLQSDVLPEGIFPGPWARQLSGTSPQEATPEYVAHLELHTHLCDYLTNVSAPRLALPSWAYHCPLPLLPLPGTVRYSINIRRMHEWKGPSELSSSSHSPMQPLFIGRLT